MAEWTAAEMSAWLAHFQGGSWDVTSRGGQLAGPLAVVTGQNVIARQASASLPLEREPAEFHQFYDRLADDRLADGQGGDNTDD